MTSVPLTRDEVERFEDQGFLRREGMLTAIQVKALHQRLEDIGNGLVLFPDEYVQIEPQVEDGSRPADPVRFNNVRKIWNLTRYDNLFREYVRHPAILDVVHSLIGPDLKVYVDQTLCKPPRVGSAKPPHQDSAYWTSIDPPNLVICWMALDDATRGQRLHALHPRLPQAGRDRAQAPGGHSRRGRVRGLRKRGGRSRSRREAARSTTAWPCIAPTPTPVPIGASA